MDEQQQSKPPVPEPPYTRISHWMPLVVQWTGIFGFVFELITGSDNAPLLAATVTFAIGGKLGDLLRGIL